MRGMLRRAPSSLRFRAGIVAALIATAELSSAAAARGGDAPSRAHLDALWRQHMLAGTHIAAEFRNGEISTSDFVPTKPFESAHGSPEGAESTRSGILVVEYGHGFWRSGGGGVEGGGPGGGRRGGGLITWCGGWGGVDIL